VRRADLILPSVAPADRPGFIIEHLKMRPEYGRDPLGDLWHTVAFDQRENGDFDRGQRGGEMQDHALWFLVVGVDQAGQYGAVDAGRGLDDIRHEALPCRFIEVRQVLTAEFLMLSEVEVAAIVNALQFTPAKWIPVLQVKREIGRGWCR